MQFTKFDCTSAYVFKTLISLWSVLGVSVRIGVSEETADIGSTDGQKPGPLAWSGRPR